MGGKAYLRHEIKDKIQLGSQLKESDFAPAALEQ